MADFVNVKTKQPPLLLIIVTTVKLTSIFYFAAVSNLLI